MSLCARVKNFNADLQKKLESACRYLFCISVIYFSRMPICLFVLCQVAPEQAKHVHENLGIGLGARFITR